MTLSVSCVLVAVFPELVFVVGLLQRIQAAIESEYCKEEAEYRGTEIDPAGSPWWRPSTARS